MNILAVGAHPDDVEILCGGTLAKYAARGDKVFIAVATNGEVGSMTLSKEEIAAVRKTEAQGAAEVIGAELIWMNIPDEQLLDTIEYRLRFIDAIRQSQADVLIGHYRDFYHPDHNYAHQILNDVSIMSTVPNIETRHPALTKIPYLYFMDTVAGVGFQPEEYVDITETFEQKKAMLAKHASQADWLQQQYGITYLEFIEIVARFRGIQCGVKYAEGFIGVKSWPRNITRSLLPHD